MKFPVALSRPPSVNQARIFWSAATTSAFTAPLGVSLGTVKSAAAAGGIQVSSSASSASLISRTAAAAARVPRASGADVGSGAANRGGEQVARFAALDQVGLVGSEVDCLTGLLDLAIDLGECFLARGQGVRGFDQRQRLSGPVVKRRRDLVPSVGSLL